MAFDMGVKNHLDRFRRVQNPVDPLPHLSGKGDCLKPSMRDRLIEHRMYVDRHGQGRPEVQNWKRAEAI